MFVPQGDWVVLAERTGCQFVIRMTHAKIADNQFKQYSAALETLITTMMIDEERERWWDVKEKGPKESAPDGQGGALRGMAQHLSLPELRSLSEQHPSFSLLFFETALLLMLSLSWNSSQSYCLSFPVLTCVWTQVHTYLASLKLSISTHLELITTNQKALFRIKINK